MSKLVGVLATISFGFFLLTPRLSAQSHYERPSGKSGPYKERVVVFVHGLFGDADATWRYSPSVYWPKLLLTDPAFQDSDVYVAGYSSPYWGNTMNMDEVVASLNSRLTSDEVFAKHREVVFVCHSLGGLVVQRLLLTFRQYAEKVPFIYFFSTPQTGSQIARLGGLFSADPLLKEMFPGDENDYLQNLENEWKAGQFHIQRFCAYEKQKYKNVLVVDRLSGTRNCDAPAIPINENHESIVKPNSKSHDSYIALRNAILANPIRRPPARGATTIPLNTKPDINVTFKESPVFTEERKKRITSEIAKFRHYLVAIGFDIPKEVPPVGVGAGPSASLLSPGSIYDANFFIPADGVDNPEKIVDSYSTYVFLVLFPPGVAPQGDALFRTESGIVIKDYYCSSFFGHYTHIKSDMADVQDVLWEIRAKYGREFSDKTLFYAIQRWRPTPATLPPPPNFNVYFSQRFLLGVDVKDNNSQLTNAILGVFEQHGVFPYVQPPAPQSVATQSTSAASANDKGTLQPAAADHLNLKPQSGQSQLTTVAAPTSIATPTTEISDCGQHPPGLFQIDPQNIEEQEFQRNKRKEDQTEEEKKERFLWRKHIIIRNVPPHTSKLMFRSRIVGYNLKYIKPKLESGPTVKLMEILFATPEGEPIGSHWDIEFPANIYSPDTITVQAGRNDGEFIVKNGLCVFAE